MSITSPTSEIDTSSGSSIETVPFSDSIRPLRQSEEYMTRAVAVIAWLFGLYWIIWRWTESLNPHAIVFSILLVVAETWGLWNSFVLLVTCWRLTYRESPPAPAGLSADVFITTYDEPLDVLRRTAIAAKAIRYPHQTHILDDGKRDEIKAMAEAVGVNYIRREGNEQAKAGNMNHALKHTSGDFILQLDADHVALPNMLDRLLGYFADPELAFVQSPQDYYNTSSFTHVVNDEGRRLWEENRMFYSLILPGKDAWNSAFFCGSCGVIRRTALDSIGGFSTLSITEDMETSIVLHAKGWKSAFHPETLAYGLSPSSALAYHVQRLRWGQGSMQILKHLNPLKQKGLSRMQKFQYFSSATTYLDGFQKLVLYFAPALFFFTGWLPVRVTNSQLLTRLIPYSILTLLAFEMLSRGTGWFFIAERYNMVRFWTYIKAVRAYFTKGTLKFAVTPKGLTGGVPFAVYAPQVAIFVLSVGSLIWASFASHYHWIDYAGGGWGSAAFYVNTLWVGWNAYFSGLIIYQSRTSGQQRFDHRFVDPFPVIVTVTGGESAAFGEVFAITHDLNPGGLSFRSSVQLEPGVKVFSPAHLRLDDIRGDRRDRPCREHQRP